VLLYLGILESLPLLINLPETFISEAVSLDHKDIAFFLEIFQNGISQLFYKEKRSFKEFPEIVSRSEAPLQFSQSQEVNLYPQAIVANGGGKDGAVAFELASECGLKPETFTGVLTNDREPCPENFEQRLDFATLLNQGNKQGVAARRFLDISQIESPSTAFYPHLYSYVFQMAIIALYRQSQYLIVGNERSANFGNANWEGKEVNHQYSKSLPAERLINSFLKKINPNLDYFSALMPCYGLKIIKKFATSPRLLQGFTSCNFAYRQGNQKWCEKCSKCAFVFLTLAAFIEDLDFLSTKVFSQNLFEVKGLQDTFIDLMGVGERKPFECVGEKEEVWVALEILLERDSKNSVIDFYRKQVRPKISSDLPRIIKKLNQVYPEHNIPPGLEACIIPSLEQVKL